MLSLAFAASNVSNQGTSVSTTSQLLNLMPIFIIFIIFYFLLIRPQKKKQQEQAEMLKNLNQNDEIITIGGICGVIVNIDKNSDFLTLKIDDNTKVKIQRSSVARLLKDKK